jgi:hypothetical protein
MRVGHRVQTYRKCSDEIEGDGGNDIYPTGRRHAAMRCEVTR